MGWLEINMQALKVSNYEWQDWQITDRYGNCKTVRKLMPREYTELPYQQPAVELPEVDEIWLNFGGDDE